MFHISSFFEERIEKTGRINVLEKCYWNALEGEPYRSVK
jgi:hypothetical protein